MKKVFSVFGVFIIAVGAVIGIPLAINESYLAEKNIYLTLWSAKDVLAYYGSVLASIGAIIGVFFSIKYAQKNYQEDTRYRSLPMLTIDHLGRIPVDPFLEGWNIDDAEPDNTIKVAETSSEIEFRRNRWYFSFEQTSTGNLCISISEQLQKEYVDTRKYAECPQLLDGNFYVSATSALYIPLLVKNVGNGCALNATVTFSAKEGNSGLSSIPISLSPDDDMHVAIMTNSIKGLGQKYVLTFEYQDIFLNTYVQRSILELVETTTGTATVKGFQQFPQELVPPSPKHACFISRIISSKHFAKH